MNILLNGEKRKIATGLNIDGLIKDLQLKPKSVVVELNQTIIQPDKYDQISIADGDRLELIRFVGGG